MPKRAHNSSVKQKSTLRNPGPSQSTSQQTLAKSQLSTEDFESFVKKCVRYIIYRAGANVPFRKSDIQKDALPNAGRNYEKIIESVTSLLKDVYGYNLEVCERTNNNKTYILQSDLPFVEVDNVNNEHPEDAHKILIMLILTHIFMSNNSVGEASLFSFLQSLDINVENEHNIFGDVKQFINTIMVKQKYLTVEVDPLSKKSTYNWGPRANTTVSKEKLLNFVCKIYKDKQPRSFTHQFEDAKLQSLENQGIQEEEDV